MYRKINEVALYALSSSPSGDPWKCCPSFCVCDCVTSQCIDGPSNQKGVKATQVSSEKLNGEYHLST